MACSPPPCATASSRGPKVMAWLRRSFAARLCRARREAGAGGAVGRASALRLRLRQKLKRRAARPPSSKTSNRITTGIGCPGERARSTRAEGYFFLAFLAFFAFFAFFAFLAIVSSQGFNGLKRDTRHARAEGQPRNILDHFPADSRALPRAVTTRSWRYPQLLCVLGRLFLKFSCVSADSGARDRRLRQRAPTGLTRRQYRRASRRCVERRRPHSSN